MAKSKVATRFLVHSLCAAALVLAAACASAPHPAACTESPPDLTYDAGRLAFVQFADSIGSQDECWLVGRGLRILRVFPETASANILLPDSFSGDLRVENARIREFTVRTR